MDTPDSHLLTKAELAERLKCHPRTIDNMMADGRVPCIKLTKRNVRFHWKDVMEALQQRRVN